jgi:hypothetical protein
VTCGGYPHESIFISGQAGDDKRGKLRIAAGEPAKSRFGFLGEFRERRLREIRMIHKERSIFSVLATFPYDTL